MKLSFPLIAFGNLRNFAGLLGALGRVLGSPARWQTETDVAKNVICLWYDGTAEEAARFYAKTFPDSAVKAAAVSRAVSLPLKRTLRTGTS